MSVMGREGSTTSQRSNLHMDAQRSCMTKTNQPTKKPSTENELTNNNKSEIKEENAKVKIHQEQNSSDTK